MDGVEPKLARDGVGVGEPTGGLTRLVWRLDADRAERHDGWSAGESDGDGGKGDVVLGAETLPAIDAVEDFRWRRAVLVVRTADEQAAGENSGVVDGDASGLTLEEDVETVLVEEVPRPSHHDGVECTRFVFVEHAHDVRGVVHPEGYFGNRARVAQRGERAHAPAPHGILKPLRRFRVVNSQPFDAIDP